jgi:TM2 domain-containing membrane protein YozV
MAQLLCGACGLRYETATGLCPRCERIDAAFAGRSESAPPEAPARAADYVPPPQVDTPPPVVIPGPPSPLSNTLTATQPATGSPLGDLARFAAVPNRIDEIARRIDAGRAENVEVARVEPVSADMECPRCAELIKVRAKVCRFCGYDLDGPSEPARRASSGRLRAATAEPRVVHHHHYGSAATQPLHSPGVAAVLSFFIPGLGQLYCGRILVGLCLMFATPFCAWLALYSSVTIGAATRTPGGLAGWTLVGGIAFVCCYIGAIVDAWNTAERLNAGSSGSLLPSKRRFRWRR